jgi:hypothetical protein
MNSFQESKNELEAAIRYAENAISSAQSTIESMEFRQEMAKKQYAEQTGREEALTKQVQELESKVQGQYDDIVRLQRDVEFYTKEYNALVQQKDVPTMPVIPKAVAIAIFREGVQHGVEAACSELEGQSINISEDDYVGDFSISFERNIDLDDELDLDWMRGKCGDYDESSVIDALGNLCADKKFECRIHGVDDQEEKKNN